MQTRGVGILAVVAAVAFGGLEAAERPKGAPAYEETTGVVSVQVPVQVFKDGRPVRGLKSEDFELFDGKEQHRVSAFEVLDADAPPPPLPDAAGATTRLPAAPSGAPQDPPPLRSVDIPDWRLRQGA